MNFFVVAFLSVLSVLSVVTATCYMPNGAAQPNDFNSCYPFHSDTSFCCDTQPSGNATGHDACLPNGLCQWTDNGEVSFWREGCSNSSWPSEWCLRDVCGKGDQLTINGNAEITPCDGTATSKTWCCGHNNTACCGKGGIDEVSLSPTIAGLAAWQASSTASVSSSTTAPASPSTTVSTSPSTSVPSSAHQPKKSISTGTKAGIGVGVTFGALALMAVLVFFADAWRRRKARMASRTTIHEADNSDTVYEHRRSPSTVQPTSPTEFQTPVTELQTPATDGRAEMEGTLHAFELEGHYAPEKAAWSR